MRFKKSMTATSVFVAFALALLAIGANADTQNLFDGFKITSTRVGLESEKVNFRSPTSTGLASVVYESGVSNDRTLTIKDPGANADFVTTAGAQTIAGVKTFSSAPVFSSPPTVASLPSAAKRVMLTHAFNDGGTIADSTTYTAFLVPGRAGTVTAINVFAGTAPIGGTNTVKVLKADSAGNTMLSAASYDPTGLTDDTAAAMTLTGTGADLIVTATQGIYVEWVAGAQTTDATQACVTVEFAPDNY